jgi:hypothetical protein
MPALLNSGLSIEAVSAPGRGKSTFFADMVKKMTKLTGEEWGFATAFLATYTPPDLVGYQFKGERVFDGVNGGQPITVTDASLPLWMITVTGKPVFAYKRGILLLDEYGQGEADVKRASAELLLNKQVGPWKLPEGWTVIACSNRAGDRSGVTKSFDFVINRRIEIEITDSVVAWTDWCLKNGVMPFTITFGNQHTNIVFDNKVPDKQGPWCTPRSLVMADTLLQALGYGETYDPDDKKAAELVGGLIGQGAASQYFAFMQLEREMPKYEKILADPKGVKIPQKPDALMLIAYNLAHRVVEKELPPICTYVERMPKEFALTFINAICKRDARLVSTPSIQKWALENSSLMAAIAKQG